MIASAAGWRALAVRIGHIASIALAVGAVAAIAVGSESTRTWALASLAFAIVALTTRALHALVERRRIELMVAATQTIIDGATVPISFAEAPGALGELERSIVRVAKSMSAREATIRAETARQQLDAEVQRALGMAENEADVVDVAAHALTQLLPHAPAEILLADESTNELHLAAVSSAGAPGCPVDSPAGCAALRGGQTLRFNLTDAIDVCPRLRGRPGGPKPAACIPLSVMGRTVGVLHATTTPERPFDDAQISGLELVAAHVGRRLRMLQMLETFQSEASTDALTGLANRRSFEERAMTALRGSAPVAIVICDIDHFKRLNDTHGHAAGDQGLRIFAQTLTTTLTDPRAICARIGGEEFALLLPRSSENTTVELLERLREHLRELHDRRGGPAFTASFGVAMYPHNGSTLKDLLGCADRALYEAKAAGRDRIVVLGASSAMPITLAEAQLRRRSSMGPPPAITIIAPPSTPPTPATPLTTTGRAA